MTADENYLKNELYSLVKSDSSIFDFLQEGSLDGMWYWDLEKPEHEWMSPRFWTLLGYDPNEKKHLTSEWQDLIFAEDLDIAIDNFNKHCADPRHPYDQVVRYRHKNGSTIWVRCRGLAIRNDKGKPVRMLGAHADLTSQKQAEESLKESEEKYRQLFQSIEDSILVTDIKRNIIDCNQAFRECFGYSKEEIIGWQTTCLYESKEEFLKIGKKLKDHFRLDQKNFTYTINYKKKSGEIFPGETNAFYLENDKGETVGFIGITKDITRRKVVEESLQKANEELERKAVELENTNTALKVLLQKRNKDNLGLQNSIYSNYELMIEPFIKKLKNKTSIKNQQNLIDIIETNLKEIVNPFIKNISNPILSFTQSEVQIATMIKQGLTNKEIAQTLNCSKRTIDTHRENIRKKLGLTNKKVNLKTFLLNFQNT